MFLNQPASRDTRPNFAFALQLSDTNTNIDTQIQIRKYKYKYESEMPKKELFLNQPASRNILIPK